MREGRVGRDGRPQLARRTAEIPDPQRALAQDVSVQRAGGARLVGPHAGGGAHVRGDERVGERVERRAGPLAARRHPLLRFFEGRTAARRVVHAHREVQRVGEAPQLSHHQPPGAQLARDREAGAEPDAERCSRAPARECIVHPRPVGEPNIQPAIERLAHELGAIGAVQHGRLAPLAMRERQDQLPGPMFHRPPLA